MRVKEFMELYSDKKSSHKFQKQSEQKYLESGS